jgi:hypothetical protein
MTQGSRGSNVVNYNYIQGRTRSTVDFGGAVSADTVGYAIAGLLGDVATTGVSAPYTHTISLKNSLTAGADDQPISYTLTDFYAAGNRSYPGCQLSDFSLRSNADGMLEFDTEDNRMGIIYRNIHIPYLLYSPTDTCMARYCEHRRIICG